MGVLTCTTCQITYDTTTQFKNGVCKPCIEIQEEEARSESQLKAYNLRFSTDYTEGTLISACIDQTISYQSLRAFPDLLECWVWAKGIRLELQYTERQFGKHKTQQLDLFSQDEDLPF